jgi:glycine/D-amino acid oxidase-like deaminating enzyme
VDNRGFRVRGGGGGPQSANGGAPPGSAAPPIVPPTANAADPDLSSRWVEPDRVQRSRQWVTDRFPDLKDVPLLETRACHYEVSSSRNFVIDKHPGLSNVWIAGGGNAEGFKFGPVIGEYVAKRVLGDEGDQAIARQFRIPETEFDPNAGRRGEDD